MPMPPARALTRAPKTDPVLASVQPLLTELIATPSQALVDDLANVVGVITRWLDRHGLAHELVGTPADPRAVVINPPEPGDEVWLLNACVDTAPVGDLGQWTRAPFEPVVEDGWLYGRGSSDSKAGVALFCELARREKLTAPRPRKGSGVARRRVTIVFDCDEHSGRFGGIKAAIARHGYPAHAAIGYPGQDEIVCGSRGFWRVNVTLRGAMGHSGADVPPKELAASKLQRLLAAIEALNAATAETTPDFPLGPRATVTGLKSAGTKTYSVTAARLDLRLDVRLTPAFGAEQAEAWLGRTLGRIARQLGNAHPSTVSRPDTWPPYRTPSDALLPRLLQAAATAELGAAPPLVVCGPSNIGNFLAQGGTQVLSGFGAVFRNAHGPDECIRLDSLAPVWRAYRGAVKAYLGGAV